MLPIFSLYLTGFVRELFVKTRFYDFTFSSHPRSFSFSENKERGEPSRNELIQFCRFAAKILSDTQELRKFVFHAFLTFENTSFNKLTMPRPVNNFLRYHRQERRDFRHTFRAHSLPSFRKRAMESNCQRILRNACVLYASERKKKKKKNKIKREGSHTHTHCMEVVPPCSHHVLEYSKTDHPPPFETPKL